MGHYHRIINLSQRLRITPMDTGVLDKMVEFGQSSGTAMAALWLLLGREAWCGDRIAILGYEGRSDDLPPETIASTGLDGTAFYADALGSAAALARSVLVERGISTFTTETYDGVKLVRADPAAEVTMAGVDVVAVDMDRGQLLDPAQFGDSRDLHLSAATGGHGGITTALAAMLAASNRGGGRGGGDLRSRDALIGSWAGDRIGVLPIGLAREFVDVSAHLREVLERAGEGSYEVTSDGVRRSSPPWLAEAVTISSLS